MGLVVGYFVSYIYHFRGLLFKWSSSQLFIFTFTMIFCCAFYTSLWNYFWNLPNLSIDQSKTFLIKVKLLLIIFSFKTLCVGSVWLIIEEIFFTTCLFTLINPYNLQYILPLWTFLLNVNNTIDNIFKLCEYINYISLVNNTKLYLFWKQLNYIYLLWKH